MFDLEDYKNSGIVELYVFELASDEERAELEGYMQQFPELQAHVLYVEQLMIKAAVEGAVPPPPEVRSKVRERWNEELAKYKEQTWTGNADPTAGEEADYLNISLSDKVRVKRRWIVWAIIIIVVLLSWLAAGIYFFVRHQENLDQLNELQQQQEQPARPVSD